MDKVLTISIAAYNVEKYLENTINSLLIENLDKLEIIIENDGSNDKTKDIAETFANKFSNSIILVDKTNGGYGSTVNYSLKIAKGKFFKQLDGDDWFNTENLNDLVKVLESIESDCVYTPHINYYENNGKQETIRFISKDEGVYNIDDLLKQNVCLVMHDLIYKTELLRKINFSMMEKCFYTDQEYVVYPVINLSSIYVFPKSIYCYRLGLNDQSVSVNGIKKHYKDHLRVIFQLLRKYKEVSNSISITKREFMIDRINELIRTQISFYLIVGNEYNGCKDLFYILKREYPEIYPSFMKSIGKKIKLLLYSNCYLYWLISIYEKQRVA